LVGVDVGNEIPGLQQRLLHVREVTFPEWVSGTGTHCNLSPNLNHFGYNPKDMAGNMIFPYPQPYPIMLAFIL